jgi:hypothetical protein
MRERRINGRSVVSKQVEARGEALSRARSFERGHAVVAYASLSQHPCLWKVSVRRYTSMRGVMSSYSDKALGDHIQGEEQRG